MTRLEEIVNRRNIAKALCGPMGWDQKDIDIDWLIQKVEELGDLLSQCISNKKNIDEWEIFEEKVLKALKDL